MILEINWFTCILDIINSLLTLGAVGLTYYTLIEMKKSREDAINPDLYIEKGSITYDASMEDDHLFFMNEESKLNLYNLGNGPAKDIKIVWETDVINRVRKLGVEADQTTNEDYLSINYSEKRFFFNQLSKEHVQNVNFVLGREKSNSGFLIDKKAMEILRLEAMCKFEESNEKIVMFNIAPIDNSIVRIEYLDPINKRIVSKFSVTTKVTIFRKNEFKLLNKIRYDFYFQRINME